MSVTDKNLLTVLQFEYLYIVFLVSPLVYRNIFTDDYYPSGYGRALFKQQSVPVEELSADICRWKSDVLKTNNCPRSESLRANMLV